MNQSVVVNIHNNTLHQTGDGNDDSQGKYENLAIKELKLLVTARGLTAPNSKPELIKKMCEYDNWNRFTIKELKNELSQRSLPISGNKDDLIRRLVEILAYTDRIEQPQKKQKTEEVQAIAVPVYANPVLSNAVSQPVYQDVYQSVQHVATTTAYSVGHSAPITKPKSQPSRNAIISFKDLTLTELKELLAQRGLKISGNKDELIERLQEFEAWNEHQLQQELFEERGRGIVKSVDPIRRLVGTTPSTDRIEQPTKRQKVEAVQATSIKVHTQQIVQNALPQPLYRPVPQPEYHPQPAYQPVQQIATTAAYSIGHSEPIVEVATKPKKRSVRKISDLDDLNINELKELLSQRGLKISGNKDELIERLEEFEAWNELTEHQLQQELQEKGLSVLGGKRDLIDRLKLFEEWNEFNIGQLKEQLSAKGLPVSGRKDELIARLISAKVKRPNISQSISGSKVEYYLMN